MVDSFSHGPCSVAFWILTMHARSLGLPKEASIRRPEGVSEFQKIEVTSTPSGESLNRVAAHVCGQTRDI
jgi:hypothetical protein